MLNWNQHKERTDQRLDTDKHRLTRVPRVVVAYLHGGVAARARWRRGARALGGGGGCGGARARVLDERAEEGDEYIAYIGWADARRRGRRTARL
jgi:hypothetical protein